MGLLDSLYNSDNYGGQGGGLLDLLKQFQMQQQYQPSAGFPDQPPPASFADRFNAVPNAPQPYQGGGRSMDDAAFDPANYAPGRAQPIAVGSDYTMPRIGAAQDFAAQQPVATDISAQSRQPAGAAPAQGEPPPQMQPPQASQPLPPALGGAGSILGRIGNPNGLIARLTGNDSQSIAQQNLKAQYEALRQTLQQNGDDPQTAASKAMVAVMNPEAAKTIIPELFTTKEKYQKTGVDGLGRETYGFINEHAQTVNGKPVSQAASQDSGIGDTNLKGDAYLASVPKQQAGVIQMMVEGKLPPPTSFAMSKPYWQGMIAAAKNYDPNFDETVWAARNNMQKSAQGDGKIGQNNNKLNTGIGHLTQLSDAVAGLNNSAYSQTYNGIKNAISTEFGGTGRTNFDSIVNRVAPEIVGIWRNAGGAEADIKRDIDSLKSSNTPEQLHGAILNIAGLMRSKIESNNYEYKTTMGHEPPQPFIRPDAEAALQKLQGLAGGQAAQSGPAKPATVTQNGHTYTLQADGSYK